MAPRAKRRHPAGSSRPAYSPAHSADSYSAESVIADRQFARDLIRRKARQMANSPGFSASDADELEQELELKLFKSLDKFDPKKADWRVYVTVVVDRMAASLFRNRHAGKRSPGRVCSLSLLVADEDGRTVELASSIGRRELDARLGCETRCPEDLNELALDLGDLLKGLSAEDQAICRSAMREPVTRVAKDLGVPRSTVRGRLRCLRESFEQAGLQDYL